MRINKKWSILVGLALGLVACSDMALDENEAIGMPSDFDLQEYVKINPDVKYQQIRKDLMDHGFYNQARLDTIKRSFMTVDSELVIVDDGAMPPAGAKPARAARDSAQARVDADNAEFLKDTALAHKVFSVYVGFADSLWKGVDSLNADEKKAMFEFNKQQVGAPNVKEDKDFLEKFSFDEDLMFQHYLLLGALEGRAYRYCTKDDKMTTPFGKVKPDTLGSSPIMLDYSAGRFCYDSKKEQKYLIQ